MSEREWGPFVLVAGTGRPRRVPRPRLQRVDSNGNRWIVGVGVSWLGRDVVLVRNRWADRKATWARQAWCWWRGLSDQLEDARVGPIRPHPGHRLRWDGDVRLDPIPQGGDIMVIPRLVCRTCDLTVDGPRWGDLVTGLKR